MKSSDVAGLDGFAGQLRAAVARQGVSLAWLRDRLAERGNPVSLATLSYWRSGRRNPEGAASLAAIAEIEDLLDLPPAHLTARLGPPRRVGPLRAPVAPFETRPVNEAVEETTAALATPVGVYRELSTQIVADLDERGVLHRRWIRSVVQVTSGTVTEYPWIEVVEGDDGPPVFSHAEGARLGRSHVHPSGTAYGVVLELERPVSVPDTFVVEWVTDYPDDHVATLECMHGRGRAGGELLLWMRFHPDRQPVWCEEFTDDDREPAAQLAPGPTAHAVRHGFGPGVFGLRWGFEPRQ